MSSKAHGRLSVNVPDTWMARAQLWARRAACAWVIGVGSMDALATEPVDPLSTLAGRMQLFHDGALRGFSLSELPDNGIVPYTDTDFRDLAATGANVVRVAILLRKCAGCERYDEPDAHLRYVEQILAQGQRLGFRVIVTLLPMPGFSQSDYWDNPVLQSDIVRQWGLIAARLKDRHALQAYDLVNEPIVPASARVRDAKAAWHSLAAAAARELRRVDPSTPVMIEPTPWGLPGSFAGTEPLTLPGLVYSFHMYAPHEFTHQGLPGYTELRTYPGHGWDKARLSAVMEAARRFAGQHRVPMFVGEFSCVRWAPEGSCPRYLADAVALFEAEGWGWTYHCWRCYQGWDAEVPASLPQAQRSGRLPEHRKADNPTAVLLREALSRNGGVVRSVVPAPR
jgi:endoglucanase